MTIAQMEYFTSVCEYGSITKASEMLHISQPTISMAIKDLEHEFGITLFTREAKKLSVTQEGMYVYKQMTAILSQISSLSVYMCDVGKQKQHLTLGIPTFSGNFLFANMIDGFYQAYPDIQLNIVKCISQNAVSMLNDGTINLAIIVERELPETDLAVKTISTSEFVFCVSNQHPLAKNKVITIDDIVDIPIILNNPNSYLTKIVKNYFYKYNKTPNVISYAPEVPIVTSFLRDNKCGTFIYKQLADTIPQLVGIPLDEKLPVDFSLIWNKNKPPSKNMKLLIDYIMNRKTDI